MPELPEVETTVRELRPELMGRSITRAEVLWPRTIAEPAASEFCLSVAGQQIIGVGRRGKYIVISLASGSALLVHLRMTGRLLVEPGDGKPPQGAYLRAWLGLGDGRRLIFEDQRKFGRIWLLADAQGVLGKLGPEPLSEAFTAPELAVRLAGRRAAIKPVLLDQTVVAGIGNIYADESLFLASIHPLRPADRLGDVEIERLHAAIRQVLGEAVQLRGTTLRDYRPPYGGTGNYQERRRVYGREDEPCPHCGAPIVRRVIAQRSAHFCPRCQAEDV